MPPLYNNYDLVRIDDERIDRTCEAFFKWKDLNNFLKDTSHRGMNMPDAISEPMACWCLGLLWNRGDEAGDATDPRRRRKIEFKATSRFEGDLSSFGPICDFDDLVFLRFDVDDNKLWIYDLHINADELSELPANSYETVGDQQRQGRRPHISLYKLFVLSEDGREERAPDIIFDIRRCKIIEDNR